MYAVLNKNFYFTYFIFIFIYLLFFLVTIAVIAGVAFSTQIHVLRLLNHPHCIKQYEVFASRTTIFMVVELMTGGELFDRIVTHGKFDEISSHTYFVQLIEGLEHCHRNGVCHRDLKPENLLVDSLGNLKITDFGLASQSADKNKQYLHTICGTPNYVAPEVLIDKGYDGKNADIWSTGVILYVFLAGFLPFDEANMVDLFRKIITADFQYPPWISREALHLLSRLLESDPSRRATIEEIKKTPFYKREKLSKVYNPIILYNRNFDTIFDDTFDAALNAIRKKEQHRSSIYTKFTQKWKGQRIVVKHTNKSQLYLSKQLNAFDLINIISGQSMNNMIMFNKNNTPTPTTTTFTQFISRVSINNLIPIIDCVLLETPSLQYRICYRTCCILFIWCNQKNHNITGKIEVFTLVSQLHMVQCKRIEGSILVFHEFYKRFRDNVKLLETNESIEIVKDKLNEWQSEHDAVLRSTVTESDTSDTDTGNGGSLTHILLLPNNDKDNATTVVNNKIKELYNGTNLSSTDTIYQNIINNSSIISDALPSSSINPTLHTNSPILSDTLPSDSIDPTIHANSSTLSGDIINVSDKSDSIIRVNTKDSKSKDVITSKSTSNVIINRNQQC